MYGKHGPNTTEHSARPKGGGRSVVLGHAYRLNDHCGAGGIRCMPCLLGLSLAASCRDDHYEDGGIIGGGTEGGATKLLAGGSAGGKPVG